MADTLRLTNPYRHVGARREWNRLLNFTIPACGNGTYTIWGTGMAVLGHGFGGIALLPAGMLSLLATDVNRLAINIGSCCREGLGFGRLARRTLGTETCGRYESGSNARKCIH